MQLKLSALAALSAVVLVACAGAPPVPRETASPFVIERDLAGATVARGEFSSINGVRRSFTAYLEGKLVDDTFTLFERFEYDDGEKDQKTWVLKLKGEGVYAGTREDVVGEARGWQDGPVFRLEYDIRLPNEKGEPGMLLRFRDVMAKTSGGEVINNARVGKWGFNVGQVSLVIRGEAEAAPVGSKTP
jgi:hypothetical protein